MVIPAMALLQQNDARQDIMIEPAVRQRAVIEAWGHSELGAQSGRKNQPACFTYFVTAALLTPSSTMWLRLTYVPSGIWIHPAIWPQYSRAETWGTDRTDNSLIA